MSREPHGNFGLIVHSEASAERRAAASAIGRGLSDAAARFLYPLAWKGAATRRGNAQRFPSTDAPAIRKTSRSRNCNRGLRIGR